MSDKHVAYNRSEKGLARYRRYNLSAKGRSRDQRYIDSGRKAEVDHILKVYGLPISLVEELRLADR